MLRRAGRGEPNASQTCSNSRVVEHVSATQPSSRMEARKERTRLSISAGFDSIPRSINIVPLVRTRADVVTCLERAELILRHRSRAFAPAWLLSSPQAILLGETAL